MELITKLESTRKRTLHYFDLGDEELDCSYAPGKWSVRFILHHLADAETVLSDRIRRTISEPFQVIWAFDQDAWAAGLDYSNMPLDLSRQLYDASRARLIYLVGQHYERSGHLEFVHSETGIRTLRGEFDKVAEHNEHHLAQIEAALKSKT